jgi:hypothetical protein
MQASKITIHPGDAPVPDGAQILYEAEWNEEATAAHHRRALVYFASECGIAAEDVPAEAAIPADDPDWFATVEA